MISVWRWLDARDVDSTAWPSTNCWMHCIHGVSVLCTFSSVLQAQNASNSESQTYFMFQHKSWGLVSILLLVPRLAFRIQAHRKQLVPLRTDSWLLQFAASAVHQSMYLCMVALSISALGIGLYGGKGFPLFLTSLPSFIEPDIPFAKYLVGWHRDIFGFALICLVCLHIAAVGGHTLLSWLGMGGGVIHRIDPLRLSARLRLESAKRTDGDVLSEVLAT